MKQAILKEIPLVLILLVPILFLANYWNTIPDIVPIHYNFKGEADNFGSKKYLILVILILPVFTYILLTIIPWLDKNKKLAAMGNKYTQLKYVLVSLMSALSIYIINVTMNENQNTFKFIAIFTSIFFILIGNYLKTLKTNHYVGVRTPWTLNNEAVWKKTHEMTSYLWIALGVILLLAVFLINNQLIYPIFLSIIIIASIIPIVYSYLTSKSLKNV